MNWNKVEDGMPPMPPHSHDGATERVLVWVEKDYYPHVYPAYYEYTEDGSDWHVDGSRVGWGDWKVTHWMKEPAKPETRQRCTNHKWLDTLGQLPCWPPIKIYKCGLCNLTGNLQGRLLTPNGFPQYDLSDMTYEGCPENGQTK